MQIDRLFGIVYMLLEKKSTTAKVLSDKFEVSIRTIYRDIDTLSLAGIPIYTNKGKGGGIFLHNDFIFDKSLLSTSDHNDILIGLQSLKATKYLDVDKTLTKLSSLFSNHNNWIEIDFTNWNDNGKDNFIIIKQALINHLTLTFTYFNTSSKIVKREVEPIKLLFKSKSWYLYGYCLLKQDIRLFKISRISNIEITNHQSVHTLETQIPINSETKYNNLIDLTLKFDAKVAYRILDEFHITDLQPYNNSYIIKTSLPKDDWLYGYLLSFMNYVEIISPLDVKIELKNRLEEMIKKYQ